jgi:hypothetical protein
MKKNVFLLLIFIVLFFEKALAQGSPEFIIIAASDVNIREEPTTTGKVLTRLQLGQIAKILKKSDKPEIVSADQSVPANYWYKISFNGQSGWVYGAFAFELEKVVEIKAPWALNLSKTPEWVSINTETLSIYNAATGISYEMGRRTCFYVLIDGSEVSTSSKAILLEGDSTTEKFGNTRYRNMISSWGNNVTKLTAGFDENENLVISIIDEGFCGFCSHVLVWEGKFLSSSKNFMFTHKYGTRIH